MTDEEKVNNLSSIDRVEDVRFIQLSLKDIVIHNLSTYYSYLELMAVPTSYFNLERIICIGSAGFQHRHKYMDRGSSFLA